MGRRQRAQRASRAVADDVDGIRAARRTRGNATRGVQLDVSLDIGQRDGVVTLFAVFQCPLLNPRVNLAEVVDASIRLRGRTGFHKVRNRDRRQQADDGHNDHDFNERETRLTDVLSLFHFGLLSFFRGGTKQQTGYII